MRIAYLLLILSLPLLEAAAVPYIEVGRISAQVQSAAKIRAIAMSDCCAALGLSDSTILLCGGETRELNITSSGLFSGEEILLQSDGRLYAISGCELMELAECIGCAYAPHSKEKYAVITSDGLKIRDSGEEKYLKLRPQAARWSEDGSYLATLDGSSISLIKEGNLLWRSSITTQVFDISIADGVLAATTKNCEIYAYSVNGGIAWTNRICDCCIPLKLSSTNGVFAVALQGRELVILDAKSGRVLQRLSIPAYRVSAFNGLIAAVDSNGTAHILADSSGLRVEGKSSGILLEWDLPAWVKGELLYEVGGERGTVKISQRAFIPVRAQGNLSLKLRDPNGVEVERSALVKSLKISLSPDGEVRVEGEGELAIESAGKKYNSTEARVDTGFLPTYSVTILNYGVPVARYDCYNSRFTLVALIPSALIIIAIVRRFLLSRS